MALRLFWVQNVLRGQQPVALTSDCLLGQTPPETSRINAVSSVR